MELVDRLGFDAIDAGTIAESTRLGPDGPAFGVVLPATELNRFIAPQRAKK